MINDDYDHCDASRRKNSAIGLLFVTEGCTDAIHMGGTGDYASVSSVGTVNIWHWTLANSKYGEVTDVENMYAYNSAQKYEEESSILGVFGHSGGTKTIEPLNGTTGTWYFEFIRKLTTSSENDIQFNGIKAIIANIAYWDPDQTPNGFTTAGHYTFSEENNALLLKFGNGSENNCTPKDREPKNLSGFLNISLILVLVPFGFWRLKRKTLKK